MIITCNKCSSSFNLDDSLVKETGSKVRCSLCKDIFTAYPLPPKSEQEPEALSVLDLDSDTDDGDSFEESNEFEIGNDEFSLSDPDLKIESSDFDMDGTGDDPGVSELEVDDDFSFDGSEFEIDEDSESLSLESDEDSLDFEDDGLEFEFSSEEDLDGIDFEPVQEEEFASLDSDDNLTALEIDDDTDLNLKVPDYQTDDSEDDPGDVESLDNDLLAEDDEDEFELEFDVEDDSGDEIPDSEIDDGIVGIDDTDEISEINEIPFEMESEPEYDESPLSLEESKDEEDESVITAEDSFSEYDEVLEQETEPEEDLFEEEPLDVEEPLEETNSLFETPDPAMYTAPPPRRKKKSSIWAPILVLLLIFLLVAGAYIASIMTGYKIPYLSDFKIPFIEQYLKKPAPETSEAKPIPNQKSVNGRFVTNSMAGTLFVITGRVENPSNLTMNHIEVRGTLITKGKVEAKTKNVFCGNIITEEMLKTGNIADINKLLATKEGTHNSNINVKPGASVPFMVVFSELPEKLQNFTVKVSSFNSAGKS